MKCWIFALVETKQMMIVCLNHLQAGIGIYYFLFLVK